MAKKKISIDGINITLKDIENKSSQITKLDLNVSDKMVDIKKHKKLLKLIFKNSAQVQDDHRFNLEIIYDATSTSYKFIKIGNNDSVKIPENKVGYENIVLLLESPHMKEFKYNDKEHDALDKNEVIDKITAIKPARGSTGENIEKYLLSILFDILPQETKKYQIFIVNPLQFQTSFWAMCRSPIKNGKKEKEKFKDLRNDVWISLWDYKNEDNNAVFPTDFLIRLYNLSPSYILNCCTAELRFYVCQYLYFNRKNFKAKYYECYHPAINWHRPTQRMLK